MAIDDNVPNSNASKNLDAASKPLYPSSYVFNEIILINKEGTQVDIQKIVTSLIIVEEIYSPLLTARIRIRDNENFFDDFKLSGQEIVKVSINYLPNADRETTEDVEYEFVVKDYPLFDKTTESINVQEYEINLVSSYSYLSRLQQISIGVAGNPVDNIEKIFKKYLGNPTFEYKSKERYPCIVDDLKAVITQKTPLQAVEFLKGTCYDEDFAPFFIYTTLEDSSETGSKIIARSWADVLDSVTNPVYYPLGGGEPYSLRPFEKETPGSEEYFKRLKTKIIRFKSNIKLDKLTQAINGGIGNVTEVVDLNERTYTEERSLPKGESPRRLLEQASPNFRRVEREDQDPFLGLVNRGSETFESTAGLFDFQYLDELKINGVRPEILETILNEPRTSREVYYIPVDPYGEGFRSSSEIKKEALKDTKLYKANMEGTSHEIVTYGDLNLKAGAKIEIEIPKSDIVDSNEEGGIDGIDQSLSGIYVISTTVHEFTGGVYTNQLKIIREGSPDEILAMNTTGQNFNSDERGFALA